jgi:hypothetical protein
VYEPRELKGERKLSDGLVSFQETSAKFNLMDIKIEDTYVDKKYDSGT